MKKLLLSLIVLINLHSFNIYCQSNHNNNLIFFTSASEIKFKSPLINDNSGLNYSKNYSFIEKKKNVITAGAGFLPGYEDNLDFSLQYLQRIGNNIHMGGGLDLYYIFMTANAGCFYNFIPDNNSIDLLLGAGFNIGTVGAVFKVHPQISAKIDFHLNDFNTIGIEVKNPFIKQDNEYTVTPYILGCLGFKF